MMIQKLDITQQNLLNISVDEIMSIHRKIVNSYYTNFANNGLVRPLWDNVSQSEIRDERLNTDDVDKATQEHLLRYNNPTQLTTQELWLVFLYKYKGNFVHKDLISAFVRKYHPDAGLDQQIRHLGSQKFWYVLNKNEKVPDTDCIVPSGYHYLCSIETPHPKAIVAFLKRRGRVAAKSFQDLKMAYHNRCATCGAEEGKKDWRTGDIVTLQQGHMDPRKPLTIDNTIPQCAYCNQTYKDYFRFDENGHVIAVNNPEILLRSPRDIQDEMVQVLLQERQKADTQQKN